MALLLLSLPLLLHTAGASAVTACPSATTLPALVTCLKDSNHLPRSGSDEFVPPTATELTEWASVVTGMLDDSVLGSCDESVLGTTSFSTLYEIVTFSDADNGESYCVLAELALINNSNKKAWGTYIVALNPQRELAIQIPHPLNDSTTPEQGIAVFRGTGARSFLLSGAHRNANDATSTCQSNYKEADGAHEVNHMFQPTTEATVAWYETGSLAGTEFVAIQFHGMGSSTCPNVDVYMTYGRPPSDGTPASGTDLLKLEAEIEALQPGWTVIVPGESPTCGLHASTNTQGRYLNGVDASQVCGTYAQGYTGRFIHVEQKIEMRNSAYHGDWIAALNAAFPLAPVPCTGDPDCDDGEFCNGAESCVGGSCVAGTDPCAPSGQTCDEVSDTCVPTPAPTPAPVISCSASNKSVCNNLIGCFWGDQYCNVKKGKADSTDQCCVKGAGGPSPTPGSVSSTPTPTPAPVTCPSPTGRPKGVGCTDDCQCASNKCKGNGECN